MQPCVGCKEYRTSITLCWRKYKGLTIKGCPCQDCLVKMICSRYCIERLEWSFGPEHQNKNKKGEKGL